MIRSHATVALTLTSLLFGACTSEDEHKPPTSPFGVLSNLPDLAFEPTADSAGDMVFVSSNYVQEIFDTGETFQQWFVEVENRGTATACEIHIDAELRDAAGAPIAHPEGEVDALPHGGFGPSIACLGPGERGVFYDINEAPAVDVTALRHAVYTITYNDLTGIERDVREPEVNDMHVVKGNDRGDEWIVVGELVGRVAPIQLLAIDVYPRSSDGLVIDHLVHRAGDPLASGETRPFTTTTHFGAEFSTWSLFHSFTEPASGKPAPRARREQLMERLRAVRMAPRAE
jgi:hypothetical protein